MHSAHYLFILSGFLLAISVFNVTSDFADCDGMQCTGRNASNLTGARWPEEIQKEHGMYRK